MSGSAFFSDLVGSGVRPTIEFAEGGAERQDSVTNDLRQMNEPPGARARGALSGPTEAKFFQDAEEAETTAVATTAVASNAKSRAAFESQNSDHVAESDVAEETMSAMVKLAKDLLEPYDIALPTAECHIMAWLHKKELVTQGDELRPVQVEEKTPMGAS